MKKLFFSSILVLLLAVSSLAFQAGVTITKIVNGDWEVSIPVNFDLVDNSADGRAYVLTKAVFTAPRANPRALNHSRFEAVVGGGFRGGNTTLDLDTGATYWWAENNEGQPEGFKWKNSLNLYSGNRYF